MDSSNFTNYLLERKKQLVLNAVHQICGELKIDPPDVNFDGCPGEREDALAHIHLDSKIICISERQLNIQDHHTLRSTVEHEIAHLFVPDHSATFTTTKIDIGTTTWKPPGGVTYIRGETRPTDDEQASESKLKSKRREKKR